MALLRKMGKTLKIDEKVEGVLRVAAATAVDVVGDVIDHIHQKYTDSHECLVDIGAASSSSDSDRDNDEVKVEGVDIEGHHKELADIEPFLKMAMYAYKDKDMDKKFPFVTKSKLVKDLRHPTLLVPERDITTDTEVHVCVLEDGSLAFAFRGTECRIQDLQSLLGDVMTDLLKAQVPVELYNACDDVAYRVAPSIRAHQGFQIAFRDVTKTARPDENLRLVAEGLGAQTPLVRRVICIGHSLGGALATLCAQWCRYVAYPKAEIWCVTIGSPRVGNRAFAKDFNNNVVTKGKSYRVVNKGDLVPGVPIFDGICKVFTRYKHVDGCIYLIEDPTREGTITLKSGGRCRSLHIPSFNDHHCKSYRQSVKKALAAFSHHRPHMISLPPFRH
ncbi:hypothetical protein GOP47_0029273 [Adiantum capillus-veneris]|nr:hypothetical protein GOP47_0029273 [Adiantum capillus-veneris]